MNTSFNELTGVNSWHINQGESAALWKLYGDAIAIRSSVGRLTKSIGSFQVETKDGHLEPVPLVISKVKYLSDNDYKVPSNNVYNAVLRKRYSFSHERELRAVISVWAGPRLDDDAIFPFYLGTGIVFPKLEQEMRSQNGILVPVDLTKLIHSVVVSPLAPSFAFELVKRLTARILPKVSVEKSRLNVGPSLAN